MVQIGLLGLLSGQAAVAEEDASLLVPSSVPLPSRKYEWNLLPQPDRPWLQMPHFEQSPILPERVQFNTIPKANLLPENLRPRNLENQALTLNILEHQELMPPHLLDAPLAPPRVAPVEENRAATPYTGSMIFLPNLPPPQQVYQVRPLFDDPEPMPNHRMLLGW